MRIAVVAGESQVFAVVCSAMLASNEVLDVKGIDVNLPTATSAQANNLPDFTIVGIDALMDIYFEKEKVAKEDVLPRLQKLYGSNHNVRILFARTRMRLTRMSSSFWTKPGLPEFRK